MWLSEAAAVDAGRRSIRRSTIIVCLTSLTVVAMKSVEDDEYDLGPSVAKLIRGAARHFASDRAQLFAVRTHPSHPQPETRA
jgi:hypothetical protein